MQGLERLYRVYKKKGNLTLACHCALNTGYMNVFLHGHNRIFSSLGIETKFIQNLLPLGLDLNMHKY